MAKFTVEHNTQKSPDETYKAIKDVLSKENLFQKYDANAKCTFDDGKKSALVTGSQFKADMKVSGSAGKGLVSITVDLPFLLMPFKGKIQDSLKRMLDKHLA
jgi:hypothetical protein